MTLVLREEIHDYLYALENPLDSVRIEAWNDYVAAWEPIPLENLEYGTGSGADLHGNYVSNVGAPGGTVSYVWDADLTVGFQHLYQEPGTYGYSTKIRASAKTDESTWASVSGLTVNPEACYWMLQAGVEGCPTVQQIHIRHAGFRPNITQGDTSCVWDDSECSRCVDDLLGQFTGPNRIDLNNDRLAQPWVDGEPCAYPSLDYCTTPGMRIASVQDPANGIYGPSRHNQGLAVLRQGAFTDDGEEFAYGSRIVLTENANDNNGLMISGREQTSLWGSISGFIWGREWIYAADANHSHYEKWKIMDQASMGRHKHPGGAQAHGDLLVVAMEKPVAASSGGLGVAAAYFFRVDGLDAHFLHAAPLGGSSGDAALNLNAAATAGFVRLASGYYLLAVSGGDHGRDGIWFYESSDTILNEYTQWNFVDFYASDAPGRLPKCNTANGEMGLDCYVGAGGGINLVTDCSGKVYAIAMTASNEGAHKDYEYVQALEISQSSSGRVVLIPRHVDRRNLRASTLKEMAFRWSGGTYVSKDGDLILLASERHARLLDGLIDPDGVWIALGAGVRVSGWLKS